jgi:hypothetical protein
VAPTLRVKPNRCQAKIKEDRLIDGGQGDQSDREGISGSIPPHLNHRVDTVLRQICAPEPDVSLRAQTAHPDCPIEHPELTHVFAGRYGAPWTQWAVHSQMRRLNVDWHFHDLRAKAATDAEHLVLGKQHSALATYRRGVRESVQKHD